MYEFITPAGSNTLREQPVKERVNAVATSQQTLQPSIIRRFRRYYLPKILPFCMKKSIARPLVYTSAALPRGGQGGAQCRPPEQPETEQKRRFPRYAACGKPPFIFVFALRSSGFAAFLLIFVHFRQRKIAPYASIGAKQVYISLFTAARLCR